MTESINLLQAGDGLLLVDVQKDFCPGGALAVAGGHEILPVLNQWIAAAEEKEVPVYASRDWHPKRHTSFQEQGGQWPPHCIQDTPGADFHPDLRLPGEVVKITKGVRFDQDQNSVFDQTGFAEFLKTEGVGRLWVAGLAQDVCVLATVLDARKAGIDTQVILAGTRPVDPEGGKRAVAEMTAAGARMVE